MTKTLHRLSIACFCVGLILLATVPATLSVPGDFIPIYLMAMTFFTLATALARTLKWKVLALLAFGTAAVCAQRDFDRGMLYRERVESMRENAATQPATRSSTAESAW